MAIDFIAEFMRLGVIQFGQFAVHDKPGTFAPLKIDLGLLASYPAVLSTFADEIAPLTTVEGITHLLAMPPVIPLGTAISLKTEMPLLYPSAVDPEFIEGAYDFNVPTLLLTGVFTDGIAERAMIKRVKSAGLDVKMIVTVFDFRDNLKLGGLPIRHWRRVTDLTMTPAIRRAVERWQTD